MEISCKICWILFNFLFTSIFFVIACCVLDKDKEEQLRLTDMHTPFQGYKHRKKYDASIFMICQDDLRFFKNLQWNIIYYQLLLFGAIFAIAGSNSHYSLLKIQTLTITSFSVFYLGFFLLLRIQYDLRHTRVRLIHTLFYQELIPCKNRDEYDKRNKKLFLNNYLFISFTLTLLFALYVVITKLWFDLWKYN